MQKILDIKDAPKNGDGFWLVLEDGIQKPAHIRTAFGTLTVDEDNEENSDFSDDECYYILCLNEDFTYDWETCTEGYDLDDDRVLGWIAKT